MKSDFELGAARNLTGNMGSTTKVEVRRPLQSKRGRSGSTSCSGGQRTLSLNRKALKLVRTKQRFKSTRSEEGNAFTGSDERNLPGSLKEDEKEGKYGKSHR